MKTLIAKLLAHGFTIPGKIDLARDVEAEAVKVGVKFKADWCVDDEGNWPEPPLDLLERFLPGVTDAWHAREDENRQYKHKPGESMVLRLSDGGQESIHTSVTAECVYVDAKVGRKGLYVTMRIVFHGVSYEQLADIARLYRRERVNVLSPQQDMFKDALPAEKSAAAN